MTFNEQFYHQIQYMLLLYNRYCSSNSIDPLSLTPLSYGC